LIISWLGAVKIAVPLSLSALALRGRHIGIIFGEKIFENQN
jgi:hypothetical protein